VALFHSTKSRFASVVNYVVNRREAIKSQFTNAQVNEVMESRGITRKSAVKFLSRERNGPKKAVTPVTSAPVAPAVR
jgi:hypothetical protein